MLKDLQNVLLICPYVRKNYFFEDSMRKLWDAGFKNIWIMQTGVSTFGEYDGPKSKFINGKKYPYGWGAALKDFQKEIRTAKSKYDYVLLMDFDIFLSDINSFKGIAEETIAGQYDYVSRINNDHFATGYDWNDQFVVETHPEIVYMGGPKEKNNPSKMGTHPPFGTGFEFYSKKLWESFGDKEFYDWPQMIKKAVDGNMKMGAYWSTRGVRKTGEQCWGKEWYHIANLTSHYGYIETQWTKLMSPANVKNLFRFGFFAKQAEIYGANIYGAMQGRLNNLYTFMGGKDKCLAEWNKQVEGTPLENWERYS